MLPKFIHTRDDALAVARHFALTNACKTAFDTGEARVVGGFKPPDSFTYWLVRVRSIRNKEWLIAVYYDGTRLRARYPEKIRWVEWLGCSDGQRPLIDGDDPQQNYQEKLNDDSSDSTGPRTPEADLRHGRREVPEGEARL